MADFCCCKRFSLQQRYETPKTSIKQNKYNYFVFELYANQEKKKKRVDRKTGKFDTVGALELRFNFF